MCYKVIATSAKKKEVKGFGHILHAFTDNESPSVSSKIFNSFLSCKAFLISPNLWVLPHTHKNQTIILVNLNGILAQRSILNKSTIIHKDYIQLIEYKEGEHFEYNLDKKETMHCLSFVFESKNKKNVSKQFKLNGLNNKLSKLLESKLINKKEQIISFYQGVFDKPQKQTYHFNSNKNGFIFYLLSGELQIENSIPLIEKGTITLWGQNSLSFKVNEKSKFFLLKISDC